LPILVLIRDKERENKQASLCLVRMSSLLSRFSPPWYLVVTWLLLHQVWKFPGFFRIWENAFEVPEFHANAKQEEKEKTRMIKNRLRYPSTITVRNLKKTNFNPFPKMKDNFPENLNRVTKWSCDIWTIACSTVLCLFNLSSLQFTIQFCWSKGCH
jgi:hypothetical protein